MNIIKNPLTWQRRFINLIENIINFGLLCLSLQYYLINIIYLFKIKVFYTIIISYFNNYFIEQKHVN